MAVVGIAMLLLSCGDGAVEPAPPPAPVATTVTVNPAFATLSALGETARFTAEVRDQNGQVMAGAAVTWASSDASVASVDASGLVTAAANGTATITASSGSASGEAQLVVQPPGLVVVTPTADTIAPGNTLRLAAEAFDSNGHAIADAEFEWSSSDVSVATVDDSGLVRGVADGAATITAAFGRARGTAEIAVVSPERAALVALYNATDGPNWVNNENWLTDAALGEWYGVDTDASGRVVRLEFYNNDLTGPIPSEMGNLGNLTELVLWFNNLSGAIPSELGNLRNLTELTLSANNLSGAIPPELVNLRNLTKLELSANNISGAIPPKLGNLANLTSLWLGGNNLSGPIPPELGNLVNLTALELAVNSLSGPIPPELGNLADLEILRLAFNALTGPIPPGLEE